MCLNVGLRVASLGPAGAFVVFATCFGELGFCYSCSRVMVLRLFQVNQTQNYYILA